MNPFESSFEAIWQRPTWVFVNDRRIDELAILWCEEDFLLPDWRMPVLPKSDDDAFVQFLGISSALNFCYTHPRVGKKFVVDYKGQHWVGAAAMNACLMRALDNGAPLLDANFLKRISLRQTWVIFQGEIEMPLLKKRRLILNDIGHILKKQFKGHFVNVLKDADYHAFSTKQNIGAVMSLIYCFPRSFHDSSRHGLTGSVLQFHKRAQLFAVIYHGRAMASNGSLPPIKDIDRVGPIADYQVPRCLQKFGLLKYESALAGIIDKKMELSAGGDYENEIRAMTVLAVTRLLRTINSYRKAKSLEPINICHLDYRLWKGGQDCLTPHHLTLTTAY